MKLVDHDDIVIVFDTFTNNCISINADNNAKITIIILFITFRIVCMYNMNNGADNSNDAERNL